MGIGILLLGGKGDVLLGLQSLSGAIGMTALTYFLPFAMYWICFPSEMSQSRKVWFVVNIAIGVVIMVGGVVSSLRDIFGHLGGIFSGYCTLEFQYSPSNPNDPCYESGYNHSHILFGSANASVDGLNAARELTHHW